MNHKSISTIFNIGQEENFVFRSYEYNDGSFISNLYGKKILLKTAVNIFLDYMDFVLYFLRTQTGKNCNLLLDKTIITPEYQIKIIPSGLNFYTNQKCNTRIFKSVVELFLNMITDSDFCKEDNFLPPLPEKLKEFVLASMNITNSMFSSIINGKEKDYFLLYDELKRETGLW